MSIGEKISGVFKTLSGLVKYDLPSYCQIVSVLDEQTFILKDSSLMSVINFRGVKNIPGDFESTGVFEALTRVLTTNLERKGHSFQLFFESNPDTVLRDINDSTVSVRNTIDRLKLNLNDVYDDWQQKIANYCQTERCFMVVYTTPAILDKEAYKRSNEVKSNYVKKESLPLLGDCDNPVALISELINPHRSLVQRVVDECSSFNYDLGVIDVEKALWYLKAAINSYGHSPDWKPSLWLNQKYPKARIAIDEEETNKWFRNIGEQLFTHDVDVLKHESFPGEMVKSGDTYFASFAISECPEDPEPFQSLFNRIDPDIPFRIVFDIRPGGFNAKSASRLYSGIMGWMGRTNQEVRDGFKYLEEAERNGDKIVAFRVAACTWANNPAELARRESTLMRCFQSWGLCQVVNNLGDPVDAWVATLPGLSRVNPSEITAAPLSEITEIFPLQRPSSAWEQGAMITRTQDGKIMPIQPMSPLQDTWNELFYAPPGSGKSVLVNTLTLAMVLSPGLTSLPRIAHLDVGPSASGVISLLKSALPDHLKHEVQYIVFEMSEKFSINPFDTELGCRRPTQIERDFLINLMCIFATPSGKDEPYEMASEVAGLMIDEIYKKLSDKNSPKIYEPHINSNVDKALAEIDFEYDFESPPSWWKIVDLLFSKGYVYEAGEAQKYAVPTLEDLMLVVRSEPVRDLFDSSENSSVRVSTGQKLIDMYATVISSAKREYPVLAGVTKFDVSDSKIVVLDLNNVARGAGPEGKRRAALMYMLGRQATTKSFYLSKQMIANAPEMYKAYHVERIERIKSEKKAIIYDEFHNTGSMQALRKQVVTDMREGRKWNIRVALSSQLLGDFDKDMISVSTGVYILKAGTRDDVDEAVRRFSLSPAAEQALLKTLMGPKHWGAPFLGYFQTKNGRYSQVLVNTIGPVLQWALTTTAEDMTLRDKLYSAIPADDARRMLAAYFPEGSCKKELERLRATQTKEDSEDGIVKLARLMITEYPEFKKTLEGESVRKDRTSF